MVETLNAAIPRLARLLARTAFLVLAALPADASAHRLDEYLQATLVVIERESVRLQINLTPGVAVAEQILTLIDTNHDGTISPDEAAVYAELLKRDLSVHLDGRSVELKASASPFPAPADLRTGWGIIQVELSIATDALAAGEHQLAIENRHFSTTSVYLINAAQPTSRSLRVLAQKRTDDQSASEITFTVQPTHEDRH